MISDSPVLVEYWQRGDEYQIHMVNYAQGHIKVSVNFGNAVRGKILSPDHDDIQFQNNLLEVDLDIYNILIWQVSSLTMSD